MKASDYMVRVFENYGIRDVFMVTGGSSMHLMDSFGRSSKFHYWCTEHEQSASMAAEAYAKMKNDYGLVLVTGGPAATNTITGVLDCWQDSIPVVFISGQSKRKQTIMQSGVEGLRQFGVQEVNIIPIVQSITKYAVEIDDTKKIRYYLDKALYMAKEGRPGPVWLSVPLDVQSADVDPDEMLEFLPDKGLVKIEVTDEEVNYVKDKLISSKRPVVIAGHGIRLSGGCDKLSKFLEKYSIPAVTPVMGIDTLSWEHPCNIGRTGIKGTRPGNFAMQNADLILSIGSRLPVSVIGHEFEKFAREAKVVIVDIDTIEHKKNTIENIDRIINCDATKFIEAIDLGLDENEFDRKEWLNTCQDWKKRYPVVLPQYEDDTDGINYYKIIDIINSATKKNNPVVADAGSAFYVVNQTIQLKKGQRYITTGGTATMGFSVPASIGMAVAAPEDTVIAVTGDGSFMQNLQEMEMIKYHNYNIKVFVVSNNGYFSVHSTQDRFFDGFYVGAGKESGVSFTDVEKLAMAFGVKYYRISTIRDFNKKIKEMLEEKGPALIEIKGQEKMEVVPTVSSKILPNGMMLSKPIEDMYPFLDREEFMQQMIVEPIPEE